MALLARLNIEKSEERYLTKQFNETLKIINLLNKLDTKKLPTTYHVTGLENIFREDKVEPKRVLSQKQALQNAKRVYKGYFVVKGILDEK